MSQAQFTIPLIQPVPGQLITAQLWINEFLNLQTNLNPSGLGGYSDTDTQMQIQTAPYPGSVTSHASSTAGEMERIRYQLAQILGTPYWYQPPAVSIANAQNSLVPIGAVIDFPSATPPNANFLLANGQAIGRSAYASLFALISTTFGVGDGSTTFNLPNYTDIMSIGAGNLYTVAGTGGAVQQTLAPTHIPASVPVSISISDPGHNHSQNAHSHSDSGHAHIEQTFVSGSVSGPQNVIFPTSKTPTGSPTFGPDQINTPTESASANIQNTTATNNSNTTGISASGATTNASQAAVPTLPPYLAMYKMVRVL